MSKVLIYKLTPNRTSQELTLGEYAAAGFLSAIPTTLVTAPVERAKVLLQVCSNLNSSYYPGLRNLVCVQIQGQGQGGPQYNGVFDVVKHLYKEGGVRSVFRGSTATVLRDGPGSAAYVLRFPSD